MVEWKKLKAVCEILNGYAFKSQLYSPQGIRVIRISDVQSGYISDSNKVYYPEKLQVEFSKQLLNEGDLVMSLTGNPGRVAKIKEIDLPCALNQRVACLRAKGVKTSYLYYFFNCPGFEKIAFSNSTGGAQKNLSTTWLGNFQIPIPSLAEQDRIVDILDTFTKSIDNLKEQIAQRRKQFEFYRDQLLDLEGKEGVEWKEIKSTMQVLRGKRLTKNLLSEDADYYVFHGGLEPLGKYSNYNREANTVMVINVGASAGTVGYSADKFWSSDGCFAITHCDEILSRFLYYFLQSKTHYLQSQVRHAGIPTLDNAVVEKIRIPILSIEKQQRIVSILNTFEEEIKNLEAQLKQRQKQYEYYRNKLLTFE